MASANQTCHNSHRRPSTGQAFVPFTLREGDRHPGIYLTESENGFMSARHGPELGNDYKLLVLFHQQRSEERSGRNETRSNEIDRVSWSTVQLEDSDANIYVPTLTHSHRPTNRPPVRFSPDETSKRRRRRDGTRRQPSGRLNLLSQCRVVFALITGLGVLLWKFSFSEALEGWNFPSSNRAKGSGA